MKFTALPDTKFLLAYLVAIIIFYFSYGFSILDPENINWLLSARHDWGTHYLGWAFFREEPWAFPLGNIQSYMYPIGTNVGYTDSIPLLAIPFKLVGAILPEEFQYFGLWILFCYLMIAHYTVKISGIYNFKPIYTCIIVSLVVGNPVLWYRGMHPALCAQGFLIASLYFYLLPSNKENADGINRKQLALTLITALIHPYLFAMMIGFNFILPLKHFIYGRLLTLKKAILYPVITIVGTLVLWYIVGLIGYGEQQAYSAANTFEYSFNLNSLYNSWGVSSFFPGLTRGNASNYESFMYLGLGLFVLIAISLILLILPQGNIKRLLVKKQLAPLLGFAVAITVFSVSNKAMIGDTVLYEFPLPQFIGVLGSIFRSSARFFWVVYYMLILFTCIIFVKSNISPKIKISILISIAVLQFYDTKHLFITRQYTSGTFDTPLDDQNWKQVMGNFESVITVWPFYIHTLNTNDYQDLSYLALKAHKPISTGYSARTNDKLIKAYTDSLTYNIDHNTLKSGQLYVTNPQNLSRFGILLKNNILEAEYLDGYYLVHEPQRKVIINNPTAESIAKTDSVRKEYSEVVHLKQIESVQPKTIRYNIENFSIINNVIMTSGWAFVEKRENHTGDSLFIAILREKKIYVTKAEIRERPDMISENKTLINCGFFAVVNSNEEILPTDKIGLAIKTSDGEWILAETDKHKIANDHANPVKINAIPLSNPAQAGNIDEFVTDASEIKMTGWSIFKDMDNSHTQIKVVLTGNSGSFICPTAIAQRPDLIAGDDDKYHYINCGFSVKIRTALLPAGKYKVGTMVINTKTGGQSVLISDKVYTKR